MLPPPPWLPHDQFNRWMRQLEITLWLVIVLLSVGFGIWIFMVLPAMFGR